MADIFVVVSKIKKTVKDAGYRTGGDYIEQLSKRVEQILQDSINKLKTDGTRKTLGAEDL